MASEAWQDLGGQVPTPAPKIPTAKPYPRQCEKHQDRENVTPCLACKVARTSAEKADIDAIAQTRHEADTQRAARVRAQADAIRDCRLCDSTGRLPGGAVCPHIESAPMPPDLKAQTLDAIREAHAHRVAVPEEVTP